MFVNQPRVIVNEEHHRNDRCCDRGEKEYKLFTANQQHIATALENLDCCCQKCLCFCRREFTLAVVPAGSNNAKYTLTHGTTCFSCCSCFSCCRHRFDVKNDAGKHVGHVEAECKICCSCYPSFLVKDAADKEVYRVAKDVNCCQAMCGNACNCCGCNCTFPAGYTIHDLTNANEKGDVLKLPDNRVEDDSFAVDFPKNADDDHRMLLLGATFLVDYALYDDHKEAPPAQNMK